MYQYKYNFFEVKYNYVNICNILVKQIAMFFKPVLVPCRVKTQNGVFNRIWLKKWGI